MLYSQSGANKLDSVKFLSFIKGSIHSLKDHFTECGYFISPKIQNLNTKSYTKIHLRELAGSVKRGQTKNYLGQGSWFKT